MERGRISDPVLTVKFTDVLVQPRTPRGDPWFFSGFSGAFFRICSRTGALIMLS